MVVETEEADGVVGGGLGAGGIIQARSISQLDTDRSGIPATAVVEAEVHSAIAPQTIVTVVE